MMLRQEYLFGGNCVYKGTKVAKVGTKQVQYPTALNSCKTICGSARLAVYPAIFL